MKKFYITTPIYYVNDLPHIGHAYTTLAADVLARFHEFQGEDVFFLTGTDEHGLKIQHSAKEAGKGPQEFVDEVSAEFRNLWERLGVGYNNFIRTTDPAHKKAVEKVLQTLYNKDAIYKGEYEGIYCVACEQFKSENELVDGRCPDHDIVVEKIKEECYLLRLAEIQNVLMKKIERDELAVRPEKYKKEVLSFLKNEKLKDISISRKNVSWGIPLPFDKEHTTYVWVDAFLNYLTGLGWDGEANFFQSPAKTKLGFSLAANESPQFLKAKLSNSSKLDFSNLSFWPPDVQLIGKDILRVHATIWPAILLHLGINLPKMLFVHGHLLSGGRKMSKTVGNVISIDEMVEKFGRDGTRYLLLAAGTFGEDIDITMERMIEKYNADLANGIGNLVSRVVKLNLISNIQYPISNKIPNSKSQISGQLEKLALNEALGEIWRIVGENNKFIEHNKPWELQKTNKERFREVMRKLIFDLYLISDLLVPFMPETSEKIKKALETKKTGILFPRVK